MFFMFLMSYLDLVIESKINWKDCCQKLILSLHNDILPNICMCRLIAIFT